jgi:hypothetical protein
MRSRARLKVASVRLAIGAAQEGAIDQPQPR